jgi:hypothetical protein
MLPTDLPPPEEEQPRKAATEPRWTYSRVLPLIGVGVEESEDVGSLPDDLGLDVLDRDCENSLPLLGVGARRRVMTLVLCRMI